jgi:hypothetical protein
MSSRTAWACSGVSYWHGEAACKECQKKVRIYHFRHDVKIFLDDYDIGFGKAVTGRHCEPDAERPGVMQYVDLGEGTTVMPGKKDVERDVRRMEAPEI